MNKEEGPPSKKGPPLNQPPPIVPESERELCLWATGYLAGWERGEADADAANDARTAAALNAWLGGIAQGDTHPRDWSRRDAIRRALHAVDVRARRARADRGEAAA